MSFNFADVSTTGWIAVGALAALAVVLLVIILALTLVQFKLQSRWVHYE